MIGSTDRPDPGGDINWDDVDLYRFFAFLLGAPSREKYAWFAHPSSENALAQLGTRLGAAGEQPPFEIFESYADYESGYIALFDVGMPEPPIPLLESFYKKEIPAQLTVLENTDFYAVLDLKPDSAVTAPDHLVTQLEFLASVRFLRENSADGEQSENLRRLENDYLTRHLLDWIPIVHRKVAAAKVPVFPALYSLLELFLQSRHADTAGD